MDALNASCPLIGARAVGLAQGALDHALTFVKNRRAFGQSVADYQGVRWMLADNDISFRNGAPDRLEGPPGGHILEEEPKANSLHSRPCSVLVPLQSAIRLRAMMLR
jgi:hypothetical protein